MPGDWLKDCVSCALSGSPVISGACLFIRAWLAGPNFCYPGVREVGPKNGEDNLLWDALDPGSVPPVGQW